MLATRAMVQALYTSTGSDHELSHYGLGIKRYTHFTSPIRRYADLLVRRKRGRGREREREKVHKMIS